MERSKRAAAVNEYIKNYTHLFTSENDGSYPIVIFIYFNYYYNYY
jgi:hypothetical protein